MRIISEGAPPKSWEHLEAAGWYVRQTCGICNSVLEALVEDCETGNYWADFDCPVCGYKMTVRRTDFKEPGDE